MLPIKTVYYTDEQNDEFSTAKITPKYIDESWNYLPCGRSWKVKRFFLYRVLAHPIGWVYLKIRFGWRVKNRQILKKIPKLQGCFIYGNHTQAIADAFVPSLSVFPRPVYTIVHSNNVSMPVLGKLNAYMGALPVPNTLKSARNFQKAISVRYGEGNGVMIYPEAHIWPYFVGIRNFPETAFRYPAHCNAPCIVLTNTYQRRKWRKRPRLVTYIDGPFYPDQTLPPKPAAKALRDQVYKVMKGRSEQSNCEYIRYVPRKDDEERG